MRKWLQYFLTPGNDNAWDLGYLLWAALVVEFGWKVYVSATFDPMNFGTGAAALLAAGAALQWHANRKDTTNASTSN